ncbi:MAG: adenylosuccinate synthetase [Actinomycetota bacterium]|nr:adenylosuccinate synthetase [Actinomycetota bacterium]
MARSIIVLSGPIGSGKSTLASRLANRLDATHLKTNDLLRELKPKTEGRAALQKAGEQLDKSTQGRWLAESLAPRIAQLDESAVVVIDAVRLNSQIEALREIFLRAVVHVHLTAPTEELEARYSRRKAERAGELPKYSDVKKDPTEARVEGLSADADIVIDTKLCTADDVEIRALTRLGFRVGLTSANVDVIVGGQYGSEGKGNVAFYLAPEYDLLVRVGGPNAGHKVPLDPPVTHRSLPSGTLAAAEANLLIGPGAVLSVETLLKEIREAGAEYGRLMIDPQAMIVSPEDVAAEEALVKSIGSTGQGVGEATARRIRNRKEGVLLAKDVAELRPFIKSASEVLEDAMARGDRILLEGTQGTGLSLYHGEYPHVTSRDTTVAGCLAEAGIAPRNVRRVVMVCRTYPIRVASPKGETSGFIAQEITWKDVSTRSGVPLEELDDVEKGSVSLKQRRVGEFDWALFRKSVLLNGPSDIALTFADYLHIENRKARRFDQLRPETIRFIEELEYVSGCPVSLISTRFDLRSVIDRRSWRGQ